MRAPTREWLARHSHAHGDFDAAQVAESLRAKGEQVTVVIPAKDEAATVGEVVAGLRRELVEAVPLVSELVVIDSDSTDATAQVATDAGATVHHSAEIAPHLGSHPGKGEALWKSLAVTTGDLIAFIDDCSRLITHAEFYFDQDGHSLEHCLRRAILKRGIPEAVFVDNGKIFVSRVLRTACATLGVRHLAAAPYSPASKGKIERWIGAADRSFIQELKVSPALSLEELNRRFWGWLEEFYHRRPHSSLEGKTPLDAWQAGIRDVRTVTPAEITAAFLHSAERKVDHTGCFSYNGRLYASGVEYAGKRVLLRFDPADLGSMAVFYKGEHVAEAKLATTSVQSHSQSPEPDLKVGKVGFDELMVRQKERRLKRRLGAISFSTLEDE